MNKLFDIKYVDLDLNTKEKFETIRHLAKLAQDRLIDVDKYVEDVKAREAMSTTGIGDGVAIPHAKGIDWESLDDEPVNLVFLIAVPEGEGNEHLKILQVLAVSLMDDEFKDEIIAAKDKETICEMLLAKTNK